MRPHFFTYDILKRKVTRRFFALDKPFNMSLQNDIMMEPMNEVSDKTPELGGNRSRTSS